MQQLQQTRDNLAEMLMGDQHIHRTKGNNLGVLYTGYLDKRNPVTGAYKPRFMVLTNEAVHWFRREEGYDLFGEERGHVGLGSILNIRVLDDDSNIFVLQSTDYNKRLFRCNNIQECEEWVSAIKSANKIYISKKNIKSRRMSLSGIRGTATGAPDEFDSNDVVVVIVTLRSRDGSELVLSRNPSWGRRITVPNVTDQELKVTTSDRGVLTLTGQQMMEKAAQAEEAAFDAPITGVTLASSLNITITADDADCKSTPGGKRRSYVSLVSRAIVSDRKTVTVLILSLMVLLVGLSSTPYITPDTSLLLVFSSLLSIYSICGVVYAAIDETLSRGGSALTLVINAHSFTSPDAEGVYETDEDIPLRFRDGCGGDLVEARRRWDITRHWRETERVGGILTEEQPHFNTIKAMYPHYHAGTGKAGHLVYYERPGDLDVAALHARNIHMDDLLRHWIFVTEYQWEVMLKGDQAAKSIAIIDIENVKVADAFGGESLSFAKKTIGFANAHYPERSYVIFIVNAPSFFTWVWEALKPFVHPNTQKKVRILTKKQTLEGLQEHIDISQIPSYYGGALDFGGGGIDTCRFKSPATVDINEYVDGINRTCGGGTAGVTERPPGSPGESPQEGAATLSPFTTSSSPPVAAATAAAGSKTKQTLPVLTAADKKALFLHSVDTTPSKGSGQPQEPDTPRSGASADAWSVSTGASALKQNPEPNRYRLMSTSSPFAYNT